MNAKARLGRLLSKPIAIRVVTRPLHRLVHRRRDTPCFVCRTLFAYLMTDPGFRDVMARQQEVIG